MKKTPINDKNYQISRISGISRHTVSWQNIFCKVYKIIFHQKDNFISFCFFFCLFFHKNILYTSEVIALLLTAYIIHQQIFSPSLKPTFTLSGTSVSAWNWLVLVAKYHTSRKIIHN